VRKILILLISVLIVSCDTKETNWNKIKITSEETLDEIMKKAANICPSVKGGKVWLFVDEITIKYERDFIYAAT